MCKIVNLIILIILLGGCASNRPKPGTDPLAPVFHQLVKKNFDAVPALLNKSAHYNDTEVYYKSGKGNDDFGAIRKNWLVSYTDELSKSVKKCENLASKLVTKNDLYEFEDYCLANSDGQGSVRRWVGQLSGYSTISLKPLLFDNHPQYIGLKESIKSENARLEEESRLAYEKAEQEKKLERQRIAKLEKRPDYQKCKILSDIKSNQKMIKMWDRSIASVKSNVKETGIVTNRMAAQIDRSLAGRKAYAFRVEQNEKKLKQYNGVKVSTKECKKLIPNYGKSPADQYL